MVHGFLDQCVQRGRWAWAYCGAGALVHRAFFDLLCTASRVELAAWETEAAKEVEKKKHSFVPYLESRCPQDLPTWSQDPPKKFQLVCV